MSRLVRPKNSAVSHNENQLVGKGVITRKATALQVKRTALSSTINVQNKLVVGTSKLAINNCLKIEQTKLQLIKDEKKVLRSKITQKEKSKIESKVQKASLKEKVNANQVVGSKIPKLNTTDSLAIKDPLSYSSNLLPANVENIDANDSNNVLLTPDYVNDIYKYLRALENTQSIRADFLSHQKEMTSRMRSILIDWLVNVHFQFRLLPETLYLSVGIMDRFFQKENVSKDKIQLVGVTACFIASKYEEIYPPDLRDFVVICDELYSKRDIIKCEMNILRSLKFELGRPLPLHFLRRNSKAAHADSRIHTLAKYLMEMTLIDYECSHWKPSLLAATALCLSLVLVNESSWNPTVSYYSGYTEDYLQPFVSQLCKVIQSSTCSKFQNCKKKYASDKLMNISKAPELNSSYIAKMAAKVSSPK